jgi:hypothetical protein
MYHGNWVYVVSEKGLEVDANYHWLLGWDVLCWCSTAANHDDI